MSLLEPCTPPLLTAITIVIKLSNSSRQEDRDIGFGEVNILTKSRLDQIQYFVLSSLLPHEAT